MRLAIAAASVVAVIASGLAACDGDTLRIAFQISGGPVQACPSSAVPPAPSCGDVPVLCEAVLDLRVVRPASPEEALASLCEPIPRDRKRDLCSIELIHLPSRQLPKETLEVQVMIWPRDAVREDGAGGLDCTEIYGQRVSIGFGIDNFPVEVAPAPALGGRAFYHPGDDPTVITLGCLDLGAVNRPSCAGPIELWAGVDDFDGAYAPVPAQVAPALTVSVGEPRYVKSRDEHEWLPIKALDLEAPDPAQPPAAPSWSGAVETLELEGTLCVQVIGGEVASTAAVRCGPVDATDRRLDLTGYWLPAGRLDPILAGLGLAEVPGRGMTIGVLLDEGGRPASGYRIETSPVTEVQYLSMTGQVVPGGVATTSSGLFVSQGAPYGAGFAALQGNMAARATGIGGRVSGKVTIVVLRLGQLAGS